MVVADEDPPRKRSRLSLKSKKGDNTPPADDQDPPPPLDAAGTVPQGPVLSSEQELNDCSPPVIDLTESDLPCDGPRVPPVASMDNLGNTCFLNSVLEVLRYTPCFLEGLEELYRHVVYLEKIKSSDAVQDSEEVKTDPSLAWDLVKNMFKMYKRMEKREEMFSQFANADVTSMAVKPDKVLDVIREFNPMFEGNMQHDAQELLRCLLCYLEDSERELHTDYANILAFDPSLLKTPASTSSAPEAKQQQGSNPIMEKFLSAGKQKARRGKSAVLALKFDSPSLESSKPAMAPENQDQESKDCDALGCKRSNPALGVGDLLDSIQQKTEEASSSKAPRQSKKRKVRHTKSKKTFETDDCAETDGVSVKSEPVLFPNPAFSEGKERADEEMETQAENPSGKNMRRSAKRTAVNGRVGLSLTQKAKIKTDMKSGRQPKASQLMTESDDETNTLDLKKSPTHQENCLVNGKQEELLSDMDRSQPTILSMFGRKERQCRRLGMRGRVVHRDQNTSRLLPQTVWPDLSEVSPELRRSPRKSNSAGLAAMTVSPRKQDGVMTSPTSPARPDEFPAHAVNGDSGTTLDTVNGDTTLKLPGRSLVSAQVWDTGCLESPKKCFSSKDYNGSLCATGLTHAGPVVADSREPDDLEDELPDLVLAPGADSDRKEKASLVKSRLFTTSPEKTSSPSCAAKDAKKPSPVKSNGLSSSSFNLDAKHIKTSSHPSRLMIKLQKCDHLCNTNSPTISASVAMKALKANMPEPSDACRRVNFGNSDFDEPTGNEQDSDEDEVSLGTKSSFTSVPLKSVCVKVEKCDMVCSSPEKSVSARFATTCLARQRAQRFNIIEKLFQGTMMMRTKCLECERCTERKENFQDVSVPLKAEGNADSDSETDDDKNTCLLHLMRAFTDVEHLRDDNKYYCDQCFRYVEAERSLHYEALPNILTVHLKRFSATGMFGCLSKINDHVTVPLLLSCLRYKCPKPCVRPDHRYTLFAIITHAGSTITSGHYLSYVKVRPNAVGYDTLSAYLSDSPQTKHSHFHHGEQTPEKQTPTNQHQGVSPCPADFAPVSTSPGSDSHQRRTRTSCVSEKGDGTDSFTSSPKASSKSLGQKRTPESVFPSGDRAGRSSEDSNTDPQDYHWLECDDETIRILTEKEFHGRLLEKEGALRGTPYVLFYHRLDTWRAK